MVKINELGTMINYNTTTPERKILTYFLFLLLLLSADRIKCVYMAAILVAPGP